MSKNRKRYIFFRGPQDTFRGLFGMVRTGASTASESASKLKPGRFNRRGFFGRYPDGGITRFREMSDRMSNDEIQGALRRWENERQMFAIVCLVCLLLIPIGFFAGFMTWQFLVGLVFGAILFASRYVVADFRAWQIEQQRFASPVEYLNNRLPRNMQIIEKD